VKKIPGTKIHVTSQRQQFYQGHLFFPSAYGPTSQSARASRF